MVKREPTARSIMSPAYNSIKRVNQCLERDGLVAARVGGHVKKFEQAYSSLTAVLNSTLKEVRKHDKEWRRQLKNEQRIRKNEAERRRRRESAEDIEAMRRGELKKPGLERLKLK